ncbi:MAG TPA: transcription factor [Blastocatellia bacterium]|nr:transcription factor [Blastocatellia bacterium]
MSAATFSVGADPKVSTGTAQRTNKLLSIDAEEFRAGFNRRPFFIKHDLVGHPLFSIPRLIELSRILPPEHVIHHSGEIRPETTLYTGAPRTGLSSEVTLREIEECRSWMVLRYVERDPEYRELIDRVLDEVQVYTEPIDPGMLMRQAFIFITSPHGVTPWHTDPEYSFLFQIRGNKRLKIVNPSPLSEEELEDYFALLRNPSFREKYREMASTYDLGEGQALHFPLTVPHWVHNGDEVAVSISITFQTRASDRRTLIYKTNHYLRKRGLKPAPFGKSMLRDNAKFFAYRATRRAKKLFRLSNGNQRLAY